MGMSLDQHLLEMAELDLEAAEMLYENEIYPQAVFFLQQSVEKAAKALSISRDELTEKYIKGEIKHDVLQIYENNTENQLEGLDRAERLFEQAPKLRDTELLNEENVQEAKEGLSKTQVLYDKLRKNQDAYLCPSEEEVDEILELATQEELDVTFDGFTKDDEKELKDKFYELLDAVEEHAPEKVREQKRHVEEADLTGFMEVLATAMRFSISAHVALTPLVILMTPPHYNRARYPEAGKSPLELYTEVNGIVARFPELVELQKHVLDKKEALEALKRESKL